VAFASRDAPRKQVGTRDLYPFVLSPDVLIKFEFIHRLIQNTTPEEVIANG
jgi:hypothetical protein